MARHGTKAHKMQRWGHLLQYQQGVTTCAIGGETLHQPGHLLDLAHDNTDPTGMRYLGLACRKHNRGPRDNPYGGKRWGRAGKKQPAPAPKLTRAEQREQDRINKINDRESARRARMIMPTIDDQT